METIKKVIILTLLLLMALPVSSVFAATVIVSNYFYAHANEAGTYYFSDKFGTQTMAGDNIQHDATITGLNISAQGMAAGDKIKVTTGAGASYDVTPGVQFTFPTPVAKSDYIKIAIIKSGTNEVYARMNDMNTFDDSDGGTVVHYSYSVNDIPTSYGQLGPGTGSGGGTPPASVTGNYYYFPPRDSYKYDYTAPGGISRYELHYLYPDGTTQYKRDYEQAPTGIHYLTCNGDYQMRFFNGAGTLAAQSPVMTTTQIAAPTCNSQPGTGSGFSDISVRATPTGIEWDAVPGATEYDVYKDGTKIGTTPGNSMDVPTGGGPVTVVAKDSTGAPIAQTDVPPTAPPGTQTGCNGCKTIQDMLACPEWNQYMGEWGRVIRENVPPAPDWDMVAGKMRDAIVPAMGQELINRAPELARIIADEFQSREKSVSPPPAAPVFEPSPQLPKLQDIPAPIPFDMNSNTPDFTPDFSGSEPFTIPDPSSITYSDTDKGYGYADPAAPLPSHSYTRKDDPNPAPAPSYTPTEPTPTEPAPSYTPPDPAPPGSAPPDYQSPASGEAPSYTPPDPASGSDTHEYYRPPVDAE